jgi:hypothetical protein
MKTEQSKTDMDNTKGTDNLMYFMGDMKEYLSEELKKYENLPVLVIGTEPSKTVRTDVK